ncbi:MAG: ABC transporter permease, partial [Bacteroidia bacterium]|nr:ABC transporter permease [Bacteroidia bacterium]MDW8334253.1 ABC transporter permease [Bacteroidia bacterium]
MRRIAAKSAYALTTLWGAATLLFVLFSLAGDPVQALLGPRADKATEEAVRKKIGYDRPAWRRYASFLVHLSPVRPVEGKWGVYPPDLGVSFRYSRPVWDLYLEKLPGTLILAITALTLGAALGIFLGATAAVHENRTLDRWIVVLASVGFSTPSYLAAVTCIWLFTIVWDVGLAPTGYIVEEEIFGTGVTLNLRALILPAATLAVRPMGTIVLIARERMS